MGETAFPEPSVINSKNGILQASIIAAKQESNLSGQLIPTMLYNGSLVGPNPKHKPWRPGGVEIGKFTR